MERRQKGASAKINTVTLEAIKSIDPNYDRHIENINGSTVVNKSSCDILNNNMISPPTCNRW